MKTLTKLSLMLSVMVAVAAFTFSTMGYKVGDTASDFKLKNVDNKMVSLADYKEAKGFIVTFTCNHCPYAKAYEKRIIALDKKYASRGYPLIAINPTDGNNFEEDTFENMVKRSRDKNYSFPYLVDESQEVAKKYGALKTPHIYILTKDGGNLKVAYIGAIDDSSEDAEDVRTKYAENALEELLAGKAVTLKETKAVGCSVRYKK